MSSNSAARAWLTLRIRRDVRFLRMAGPSQQSKRKNEMQQKIFKLRLAWLVLRTQAREALNLILPVASVAIAFLAGPLGAEELRGPVLDKLRKATFEVVLEKPTNDPLRYEKELPYDLLPFQVRNDKYESIGTAFALPNGQFVSAAHVLGLGSERVRESIYLRDATGRIIGLDQVLKFSAQKDFIVFTTKAYRAPAHLETQISPRHNDAVFAVGNALGQGVIARDGLYTSDTPEEERGRWNWMRFSAAASPGNSGGPLVDRDGRVVGVVLRKSANENLNYALPIAEVLNASGRKGELRGRSVYKLDITDQTLQDQIDVTLELPADYLSFGEELQSRYAEFSRRSASKFISAHRQDMFPMAAGAQALLHRTGMEANFPHVVAKQDDGSWEPILPSKRRHAEIGQNGYVTYGSMGNYMYLRLQAPDDVAIASLHQDSSQFMDLILKGVYFSRSFGPDKIRILSLGPAQEQTVHVDGYGRKWQVRRWTVPHSRQKVVTYALPVPGGFAVMLNAASDGASFMYEVDMKILTDFAFVTYYGTLKQWQDFVAHKDLLPTIFDSIALEVDYGKELRFRSARMSFTYRATLMKVTPNSDLDLRFAYFKENGRVVWDVASIVAGEDRETTSFVTFSRHVAPPQSLPDSEKSTWQSLVDARVPYNGASFFDESRTLIGAAHAPSGQSVHAGAPALFSIVHAMDGSVDGASMSQRLSKFRAGFHASSY